MDFKHRFPLGNGIMMLFVIFLLKNVFFCFSNYLLNVFIANDNLIMKKEKKNHEIIKMKLNFN